MSWLNGITRADRLAAERLIGTSANTIEIAANLLWDIWDRYFSEAEPKELDSTEAAEAGRSLYAAYYMISDAVREYHCEMGHYDEDCVKAFHHNAKRYSESCEAERLYNRAAEVSPAGTAKALHMDDESAIKYLRELIESKGGAGA